MAAVEQEVLNVINRREELLLRAKSLAQRVDDRVGKILHEEAKQRRDHNIRQAQQVR